MLVRHACALSSHAGGYSPAPARPACLPGAAPLWRARQPPLSSAYIARDPWCRTRPAPLLPGGHEVVQEGRGRLRCRRPAQPMCTCNRPFCFRRQSRSGKPGALQARCTDATGRQMGGAARYVQRAPSSPRPEGAMGMKVLSAASRKPVSGSCTGCSGPRLCARAHQCHPPGRLPGSACWRHVKVTAPADKPRRSIRGRTGLCQDVQGSALEARKQCRRGTYQARSVAAGGGARACAQLMGCCAPEPQPQPGPCAACSAGSQSRCGAPARSPELGRRAHGVHGSGCHGPAGSGGRRALLGSRAWRPQAAPPCGSQSGHPPGPQPGSKGPPGPAAP